MAAGRRKPEDASRTGAPAPAPSLGDIVEHPDVVRNYMPGSIPQADAVIPINVYVVHDQPLIAESLRVELGMREDIIVVGMSLTTEDVENRIIESKADIALLAAGIGVERLRQIILTTRAFASCLLLASEQDIPLLHTCMLAGAIGMVSAPRDFTQVAVAIRRARDGWMALTQQQLTEVMTFASARMSNPAARALCDRLSEREREILIEMATGATAEDVAERLHISRHTVQSHTKAALRKLNARSKLAAVVLMVAAGYIDTN